MIARSAGLFPYMSKKVRNTLAATSKRPTVDTARMAMLAMICQSGIVPNPSLIITVIGDVNGKRERTAPTA